SNQLVVNNPAKLNFENATSISVAVRVSDPSGDQNSAAFTISITNVNEAPTAISLSPSTIRDDSVAGTVVGTISAVDPDAGDTQTFALVDPGGAFEIVGNQLRVATAGVLNGQTPQVTVRVRARDAGGLTFESNLIVNVTHENGTHVNLPPSFTLPISSHM